MQIRGNYSGHLIKPVYKQLQILDNIDLGYDGFYINPLHEGFG